MCYNRCSYWSGETCILPAGGVCPDYSDSGAAGVKPWTIFLCEECGKRYHLSDLAGCPCGLAESKRLFRIYMGKS